MYEWCANIASASRNLSSDRLNCCKGYRMASKGQMTGMLGVYLVAAELTRRDFIVSPTSRSAAGADLLVTDHEYRKAWSVQVKTNKKRANFWLVGPNASRFKSDSHMYVFVNIGAGDRAEYLVVPSKHVAANGDCPELR